MFENYFKTIVEIFKKRELIPNMTEDERDIYLDKVASFLNKYYEIPKKDWRDFIGIQDSRFSVMDISYDSLIHSNYFSLFRQSVLAVLEQEIGYVPKTPPCDDHRVIRELLAGFVLNITYVIDKISLAEHLGETYDKNSYLFDEGSYKSWILPLINHIAPPYLNLEYRDNYYFSSDCVEAVMFALDSVAIGYPFLKKEIVSNLLDNMKNKEVDIKSRDDFKIGF